MIYLKHIYSSFYLIRGQTEATYYHLLYYVVIKADVIGGSVTLPWLKLSRIYNQVDTLEEVEWWVVPVVWVEGSSVSYYTVDCRYAKETQSKAFSR